MPPNTIPEDAILVDTPSSGAWWSENENYTKSPHPGNDSIKRAKLIKGQRYIFNFINREVTEMKPHKNGWLCIKNYTGPNYKGSLNLCKECRFEIETKVCPNCGEWNEEKNLFG